MKSFMSLVLVHVLALAVSPTVSYKGWDPFYIYQGLDQGPVWDEPRLSRVVYYMGIPGQVATCADVDAKNIDTLAWLGEVSGDRYGVSCEGPGCGVDDDGTTAEDIDQLDVNLGPPNPCYFFYNGTDHYLRNIGNNIVGRCNPIKAGEANAYSFDCEGAFKEYHRNGNAIFECRAGFWDEGCVQLT